VLDTWPAWKRLVKRVGTRFPRLNVLVSQEEGKTAPARAWFRPGSVRYSPLAVDTSVFTPGPARRADGVLTILNVAFQETPNLERKMVFELVQAFTALHREHPGTRLVLAGARGTGTGALARAVRESGARDAIEFLGEIGREEKIRLMQRCSLYVQVSRSEGFGLAIAEAMACGAPVLVAPTGEVPVVVDDCGIYVDQVSAEGIHAALRTCVERRAELPALGARARARVESTFGLARRRADLEAFLREATSG
jgi:glycosyltransferase involved in cell wall biosynthesis